MAGETESLRGYQWGQGQMPKPLGCLQAPDPEEDKPSQKAQRNDLAQGHCAPSSLCPPYTFHLWPPASSRAPAELQEP